MVGPVGDRTPVIGFCPCCGREAAVDPRTKMHDCTNPLCRVRFNVSYVRRKRRPPRKPADPPCGHCRSWR